MRSLGLMILIASAMPAVAAELPSAQLKVQITPWSAVCQEPREGLSVSCGLPQPYGSAVNFKMTLPRLDGPGQAASKDESFSSADGVIQGKITLFSVYPKDEAPPYIQVRMELISPARALCLQSVRRRDPIELPPLLCVAVDSRDPSRAAQFGVNAVIKP